MEKKVERLLNRKQLADALGVHTNHTYKLEREGMPNFRVGVGRHSHMRYDLNEVKAWFKERAVAPRTKEVE